jgi:hypothetical protein
VSRENQARHPHGLDPRHAGNRRCRAALAA